MGASGTTTVNFGAFPGTHETTVAVTGQASIVAGSLVEAWLRPEATADHSVDEHLHEPIRLLAADIIAGTGFTIYAFENHPSELLVPGGAGKSGGTAAGGSGWDGRDRIGGTKLKLYGQFTVAWCWN